MSAPTPIRHLFITLRRGLAGVREDHRAVIASLGLRKREQTVRRRNDPALRGAVEKVRRKRVLDRFFWGRLRGRGWTGARPEYYWTQRTYLRVPSEACCPECGLCLGPAHARFVSFAGGGGG